MRNTTPTESVPQPPFDFIDFPVNDVWRDHYAAQGLTYPSGRREQRDNVNVPKVTDINVASLTDAILKLTDELSQWRTARGHAEPIERNNRGLVSEIPVLCKVRE